MRPSAERSLDILPKDRTDIVHGFLPDVAQFQTKGWHVVQKANGPFSLAIVFAQRARAHTMHLIAQAMQQTDGGPVVIDGQKTDGIEPLIKAIRKTGASVGEVISKAHGKLAVFSGGDFATWHHNGFSPTPKFRTSVGVFSADKVDRGSALLVQALPEQMTGRVADLGAGWGYLSAAVLDRTGVAECHLFEAEHDALCNAKDNITDPRAQFHWADATKAQDDAGFDHVVCNPPFHTSRAATPALGQDFIDAASTILRPRGTLWMVANRHLPYEQKLAQVFASVTELAGDPGFKVLRAERPKRRRAGKS